MSRSVLASGCLILLVACSAPEPGGVPAPLFVIGEGSAQVFTLDWSPDGTRMAYAQVVEGRSAIFVAGSDGSNPVRITHGVWDSNPYWSPDGQWIAYYSDEDADIYLVPAVGGERRQLTSGLGDDVNGGWAPDGSAVVVERSQGGTVQTLFVPIDGGAPRTAATMEGASIRASLSPDGSQVLMQVERAGSMTIWIRTWPDGEPRQLTTEGFEDPHTPTAWSPDGRHILYESHRSGTADLWVVEAATGETHQLTNDVRDDFAGRWSPDGQWVAFLSNRGGQQDLWVVPAAGGNATRLTNDHAIEADPNWSRDGRTVAVGVREARSSVVHLPIDGSPSRVLVNWDGTGLGLLQPSPDGSQVLFSGDRGGNNDIAVVPVAGGDPVILAGGPSLESFGTWSPDGAEVVFTSNRGGTDDLWVVSATGEEPRRLTDWSPSREIDPKWSPDGSQIAFLSNRDAGTVELWAVPADGGEGKRLSAGLRVEGFVWSHDGQTLFVDGVMAGQGRGLYAVPSSGATPRPLLSQDTDASWPTLSPDGTMLAYIQFSAGWGFLQVVPVEGGTPRRLTTRTDLVYHTYPRWAPDGSSIVVEDFVYETNGQRLELVSWPSGEWRQLPATPDRYMLGPEWLPDSRGMVYVEVDPGSRIVVVPVPAIAR